VARYSVTHNKAGINTVNSAMWQIRATATQRIFLYELAIFIEAAPAAAPVIRLNRPTAVGTSTATVAPQPEDPGTPAAATLLDTTWSAAPTLAAIDMRRVPLPNSVGAGIVWTWYDTPLVIPVSGGLAIVNAIAAGATLGSLTMYAYIGE
jgi:hypothetical protein